MISDVTKYKPRIVDNELSELLQSFGGVLITGPKWCGKSWTAMNQSNSEILIDDAVNREKALLLPEEVLKGDTPRLVDEWQDAPILWDVARRQIDSRQAPGQFIFTGSVKIPVNKTSHTGTGRFARLKMRTMSLFESGDSSGKISLSGLFNNDSFEPSESKMDLRKATSLICRGGWPATFWVNKKASYRIPKEYIKTIAEVDISDVDGITKNTVKVDLFIRSLARNIATEVKASTISGDVQNNGDEITSQTVNSYYSALQKLFVVEDQEAWLPSLRSKTRIRTSPKRHFVDPSLAAAALGATPEILLDDIETTGFLFESLCFRDISVYAEALGGKIYHYRDENGFKADQIILLPDGRWAAIEVKLGTFEFDKAADNLLSLKKKLDKNMRSPEFLAIVTATSGLASKRDDGIYIIPLDVLGP